MSDVSRALYLIPFYVGPISILSSMYLVSRICRKGRNNLSKPREQLLLGLSLLDIVGSFGFSFSTTPAPADLQLLDFTANYPTYGNIQTCNAQGFAVQVGIAAPFYNAAICLYYVLTIRYRWTDSDVKKRLLPGIHYFIICFALGTATAGIPLKIFNYAGVMGCWISYTWEYKYLCKDIDPEYCNRGKHSELFEFIFGLVHVAVCFVFVLGSMILLYITVRKVERETRVSRDTDVFSEMDSSTGEIIDLHQQQQDPTQIQQDQQTPPEDESSSSSSEEDEELAADTANEPTLSANNRPLARRMMEIGLLYGLSFLLVYVPTILLSFYNTRENAAFYNIMRILAVTLLPLQGLFNVMIYTMDDWLPWFREHCCCFAVCCCSVVRRPRTSTAVHDNNRFYTTFILQILLGPRSRSRSRTPVEEETSTQQRKPPPPQEPETTLQEPESKGSVGWSLFQAVFCPSSLRSGDLEDSKRIIVAVGRSGKDKETDDDDRSAIKPPPASSSPRARAAAEAAFVTPLSVSPNNSTGLSTSTVHI